VALNAEVRGAGEVRLIEGRRKRLKWNRLEPQKDVVGVIAEFQAPAYTLAPKEEA